jgi:hypothetical protein
MLSIPRWALGQIHDVYIYFVHIAVLQSREIARGIAFEAAISSNRNTRQVPFLLTHYIVQKLQGSTMLPA